MNLSLRRPDTIFITTLKDRDPKFSFLTSVKDCPRQVATVLIRRGCGVPSKEFKEEEGSLVWFQK